jgi:hypothetical protein
MTALSATLDTDAQDNLLGAAVTFGVVTVVVTLAMLVAAHRTPASVTPAPMARKVKRHADAAASQALQQEAAQLRVDLAAAQARLAEIGGMTYAQVSAATEQARAALAEAQRAAHDEAQQLESLRAAILEVRKTSDLQEIGLYDFEHPAEESTRLASELAAVRAHIKDLVRAGRATYAATHFTFNGSPTEGARLVAALSKLLLSAYNAEAENAIKTVRAGSLTTATERLNRVVDRVAKNGRMMQLQIAPEYHALRLRELALAAAHLQAVQIEKEREREMRAALREEQRVSAELAREREKLEKEQQHYQNALEVLRGRADWAAVAEMEAKLADVARAIERVDYRAANQRAGYVYVISNVGAFGPGMVKIGMTRRLDPLDRVRELGDASVPFRYDIHALFFADDAVAVETMLHQAFADKRVNRVNPRREFFYVTPAEVLAALQAHRVAVVEFKTEPDAEEFRLSGGNQRHA